MEISQQIEKDQELILYQFLVLLYDTITKRSAPPGLCTKSMLSPQPSGNILSILIKQNCTLGNQSVAVLIIL